MVDGLARVTYDCSDWNGVACVGDEFHYRYDGAGKLLRFDKWNADANQVETVRYVLNGANQIACIDLDASGTCNASEPLWEYGKYGNLLTDSSTQYTYDPANRVSSITTASGTTTYTYSGDGDRISQTVGAVNDLWSSTTYLLDTATPSEIWPHQISPTMVLAETTGNEAVRYWHALDTLAQSDGTTTEYLAYDGLGSVRQLVDASGSVTLAQTFDAYGSGYATSGSASSNLGWTGEQTDSNGFVYLRARYYAPGMGRFTQMDPSRLERNAYQYGWSNPVLHTDPSGLDPCNPYDPDYDPIKCERQTSEQINSNQEDRDLWITLHSPCKDMGALFMGILVADRFIATTPWVVATPPAVTTATEVGTTLSSWLAPLVAILGLLQLELWAYQSNPDVWANCQTPMQTSIYLGGTGSISTWIVDPEQQTACARVISKQSGSSGKGGGGSGNNSNLPQKIQDQIEKAKLPQEGEMPFEPRLVKRNGQWEIDRRAPTLGPRAGKPGYVDTQGRIWIKDVQIHNEYGQHWDVQEDDGASYKNVSFEGNILP